MPKLALPLQLMAITVLALLILQWPVRRLLRWLLGPLFSLEMTRLARRGGNLWGRCAYALALLILLYINFPNSVNVENGRQASFGKQFSELFLTAQSIMVLVFVPIYFGGAISDEKERHSLDFLLSSPVTSREVVLGKYAARVISMTTVVLAGLPVVALTALWGGVDLELLTVVFVATFASISSIGAASVLCSVICRRTVTAVAWSYVLAIAMYVGCASPLNFLFGGGFSLLRISRGSQLDFLVVYVGVNFVQTIVGLAGAIGQLRRSAQPAPSTLELLSKPGPVPQFDLPSTQMPFPVATWRPIRTDALLWKERHVDRPNEPFFEALWLYFAGILMVVAIPAVPAVISGIPQFEDLLSVVYLTLFGLLTAGFCLGLLLDVAGGVPREREQRTLESLLAVPVSRGRVLRAKLLGAFYRRIRWPIAIIWLVIVGLVTGSPPGLTVGLVVIFIMGQSVFIASLALLVSVLARNTLRAYVTTLLIVAALFAATGALAWFRRDSLHALPLIDQVAICLNPIAAGYLSYRHDVLGRYIVFAALLYIVAGSLLAAIAHWRFRGSERYT